MEFNSFNSYKSFSLIGNFLYQVSKCRNYDYFICAPVEFVLPKCCHTSCERSVYVLYTWSGATYYIYPCMVQLQIESTSTWHQQQQQQHIPVWRRPWYYVWSRDILNSFPKAKSRWELFVHSCGVPSSNYAVLTCKFSVKVLETCYEVIKIHKKIVNCFKKYFIIVIEPTIILWLDSQTYALHMYRKTCWLQVRFSQNWLK